MAVGVDIDPQAIKSAHQNAALNNIGPEKMKLHLVPDRTFPTSMNERVDGVVEDLSSHQIIGISDTEKHEVVIANILLNPLMQLADHIVSYAKPGAVVGISSILSEQVSSLLRSVKIGTYSKVRGEVFIVYSIFSSTVFSVVPCLLLENVILQNIIAKNMMKLLLFMFPNKVLHSYI